MLFSVIKEFCFKQLQDVNTTSVHDVTASLSIATNLVPIASVQERKVTVFCCRKLRRKITIFFIHPTDFSNNFVMTAYVLTPFFFAHSLVSHWAYIFLNYFLSIFKLFDSLLRKGWWYTSSIIDNNNIIRMYLSSYI